MAHVRNRLSYCCGALAHVITSPLPHTSPRFSPYRKRPPPYLAFVRPNLCIVPLQTSKRRCRREGCSETPVHGPEGELPLWCHQHYFAQEQGCPLRCYVLQKDASGGFKACWRETAWAWRGKPPTHCTLHKHLGMVDVVEFFKERFDKVMCDVGYGAQRVRWCMV